MAPPSDLRSGSGSLESEGELVRVAAEVDPDLEITEIVDRTVKAGGPRCSSSGRKARAPAADQPVRHRAPHGHRVRRRALDVIAGSSSDVLEMQPPRGARRQGARPQEAEVDRRLDAEDRLRAPSQEVVLTGDDVDLDLLPIQRCWPVDPRPFITLPAVITRDRETGVRNVGMYRMQKIDRRSTFMHWQIHKDGRADLLATDGRWPVAVALGLDPVTAYSASAPLPKHIGELMVAGFLRGEPVELVRGDGRPGGPAHAEIVLEGFDRQDDVGDEARSATIPATTAGRAVPGLPGDRDHDAARRGLPLDRGRQAAAEDAWLGKATERIFLPAVRMSVPEIVDYDLPVAGAFHNCVHRLDPQELLRSREKVMHAILGLGILSLSKAVMVVDECVDVHDYEEVFFRVGANVDRSATSSSRGPARPSRPRPTLQFMGGKIGIDATRKGPGGDGPWPQEIRMSDEVGRSSTGAGANTASTSRADGERRRRGAYCACYVVDTVHSRGQV